MTNIFLKVNKDFFKLKLNPTEMLLLAQIAEFDRTTGDFFMSDKALAEQFSVSESTISRSLKALEAKGFITRSTKNTQKGKERHIAINLKKIEAELATVNLTPANSPTVNLTVPQESICLLGNSQNDLIKDNINKIKEKENMGIDEESLASLGLSSSILESAPDGSLENPFIVSQEWLRQRHNYITKLANGLFRYGSKFYRMKEE